MNNIFITYCSWQKDEAIRDAKAKVSVDQLYTSPRIIQFIEKCQAEKVIWGILSDKHGICFEKQEYEWYDLHPGSLTVDEIEQLKVKVVQQLACFSKIYFYTPTVDLHPVYQKIIDETPLKNKTQWLTRLEEIMF